MLSIAEADSLTLIIILGQLVCKTRRRLSIARTNLPISRIPLKTGGRFCYRTRLTMPLSKFQGRRKTAAAGLHTIKTMKSSSSTLMCNGGRAIEVQNVRESPQ